MLERLVLKHGVKLIPGMEVYFAENLEPENKKNYHLVLLAKNAVGYRNLLRLNYESYKTTSAGYMGKKTPRVSWEQIEAYNEGVFALTACSNGLVARTLISDQEEEKALCHVKRLHSIFQDRFFLELQPHDLYAVNAKSGKEVNQVKLNEAMLRLSHDLGIPYTITCDSHYSSPYSGGTSNNVVHDLMLAIKDKKPVSDPDRFRYSTDQMYLRPAEDIVKFFGSDIAEKGMANSMMIANACEDAVYIDAKGPILPKFPVKESANYSDFQGWYKDNQPDLEEDKAYLRYQCIEGFKNICGDFDKDKKKKYWDRVKTELDVLEGKDFCSYMLIVSDFMNWAKNNDIMTGFARGSAAGSLVSYLIGITNVDPIRYGLLFERFHNKDKKSFPDIDNDIANPELVKEYLKNKYGRDKVASISNWSTLSPKVVIKDVARSLEIGADKSETFKISNHITSIMPDTGTVEEAYKSNKEFAGYMDKYPELYKNACALQGLVRNASVHAAGVIISVDPLYELIPVKLEGDSLVAQWEKERVEEYGFVKIDLLGLNTLNMIDDTFDNIYRTKGIKLKLDDIPLDDEATFEMISKGETAGVFQLESSLTPLCIRIKPKSVEDVSVITAIGRPSCPAESRQAYISRRLGEEDIVYQHEVLKNSLKSTYGVIVFEEQMITLVNDVCGWSLARADSCRKISKMKAKGKDLVEKTKNEFIQDAIKHSGITAKEAQSIFEQNIEVFSGYGFNLSHAVAYSKLSVITAYLRCHYPTEFMCALLNSKDPNSDKSLEQINECRDMNIEITPPTINSSAGNYVIIGDSKIATGLSAIKGVGETAINQILEAQPFKNIEDFFARTNGRVVNKRVMQAAAKAGAFECFGRTRKDIHENYAKYRTKVNDALKENALLNIQAKAENSASQPIEFEYKLPECNDEWDRKDILIFEKEILGRAVSGFLSDAYAGFFKKGISNVTLLNKISGLPVGTKIKIEVILNSQLKEFTIKKPGRNFGRKFAKYLIEDVYGNTSELTVWSNEYEKYKSILIPGLPIKGLAKIDEYLEQRSLSLLLLEAVLGKKI